MCSARCSIKLWVPVLGLVQLCTIDVIQLCVIGKAVSHLDQHIFCGFPCGDAEGGDGSKNEGVCA